MYRKRNKKRSNKPLPPADAGLTMICKCCQRELTLDKFYVGPGHRYARRLYCKTCYTEETRYQNSVKAEKMNFIKKRWQRKFKNRKNKTNREYYARNKEKWQLYFKEYRARKKAERAANEGLQLIVQNTHPIGQCKLNTPQFQTLEVGNPLAQTFQFQGLQDYHFLVSCAAIYTFL
jgi:hypothetical protein